MFHSRPETLPIPGVSYTAERHLINTHMRNLDYRKLMDANPTSYGKTIDCNGQPIEYFEHPLYGEDYPIIVVHHLSLTAVATDFFDLESMVGDYKPVYQSGTFLCEFELRTPEG